MPTAITNLIAFTPWPGAVSGSEKVDQEHLLVGATGKPAEVVSQKRLEPRHQKRIVAMARLRVAVEDPDPDAALQQDRQDSHEILCGMPLHPGALNEERVAHPLQRLLEEALVLHSGELADQMPTHCGKIYITVTMTADGLPFEVFVRFGKAGHCGAAIFDGMTKLVSYALRSGMDPGDVVKAFSGIVCSYGRQTCLNAVAEALKDLQEAFAPTQTDD